MSDTGHAFEPTPARDGRIRDTVRSLASPAFTWSGDNLNVNVTINLPKEPYGTQNQNGDSVLYQAWGGMQSNSTAPNAATWGSSTRRIANQTTAVATPTGNRAIPQISFASADVKSYYAVQVTVRKSGSTTNDDQTIKVYPVPAKPT